MNGLAFEKGFAIKEETTVSLARQLLSADSDTLRAVSSVG